MRTHLHLFFLLLFAAVLLAPGPLAAQDEGIDPLESAMRTPTATGLLVVRVEEDSPAAEAGIRAGDILVSYAGSHLTDVAALNLAKDRAADAKAVAIRVVRDGWAKTVTITPGRIGVSLVPVVQGQTLSPLPAQTVETIDYAPLRLGPRDDWYALSRDGERCGFGRIRTRVLEDALFVLTDEIIDTSTALSHNTVTSVADLGARPLARMTAFRDWVNDWVRYGLPTPSRRGCMHWNSVSSSPDLGETSRSYHLPELALPVYMVETVVSLLPRKTGECFHFRPLYEGNGNCGLLSALAGAGWEDLPGVEGEKAFRYNWLGIDGSVSTSFWVDDTGALRYADYGGGTRRRRRSPDCRRR